MATTPTHLPVPSEKPQDLKFNAGKIDEFVTSMGWTYTDRFGNKHYTIEGINHLAQQVMSAFGYVTLTGLNFTTGATVSTPNEVLFNIADNSYYKWSGSFAHGAKVVPANSTPNTAGGIGPGKWLNVGDTTLRSMLSAPDGAKYIGSCPDIATLRTVEPEQDKQKIIVDFHTTGMTPTASGDTGGGLFIADFTDSTSADDNGMVIVTTGGTRWKRDMQGKGHVTPRMFGAWMDAPYIDWSTIQATGYPRAPSMGAADLAGVTDDGASMRGAYMTKLPIYIDQPIFMGDTQIDISQFRWDGISLNLQGTNQQRSVIYTSGKGGFIMGSWGHNLTLKNICFRNADSDYAGCPLAISGEVQSFGAGSEYDISNNIFLHYKFALPLSCFVSSIKNNQAYDCTYGFSLAGTSTSFSSNWARHCDFGYLWGAAMSRVTYEPVASPYPLMYVKATNIAADGCNLPHKFYQFRSLSLDCVGIEGVTGDHCLDFTDIVQQDAASIMSIDNISCDLKIENAPGVTHFISLPTNELDGPTQVKISSGYLWARKGITLLKNTSDPLSVPQGRAFELGEDFTFIKQTSGSSTAEDYIRGLRYHSRYYGEHTGIGFRTGSDGTKLSAAHQAANAVYPQVLTESGTILMPFGRALDILISTNGEEDYYGGGVFIVGEISMIPINQNGLSGTNENGGVILFGVSAKSQSVLSSSSVWSNKIAGNKSLDSVSVTKYNNGSQTFLRVNFATATMSQAILHITLTSQGMMHYYDKRWRLVTP